MHARLADLDAAIKRHQGMLEQIRQDIFTMDSALTVSALHCAMQELEGAHAVVMSGE